LVSALLAPTLFSVLVTPPMPPPWLPPLLASLLPAPTPEPEFGSATSLEPEPPNGLLSSELELELEPVIDPTGSELVGRELVGSELVGTTLAASSRPGIAPVRPDRPGRKPAPSLLPDELELPEQDAPTAPVTADAAGRLVSLQMTLPVLDPTSPWETPFSEPGVRSARATDCASAGAAKPTVRMPAEAAPPSKSRQLYTKYSNSSVDKEK
jgi:hypothetical protein